MIGRVSLRVRLAVEAIERENGLECRFRYTRGVLPDESAAHFRQLLEEIVTDLDTCVDDLPMFLASLPRTPPVTTHVPAQAEPQAAHESVGAGPAA